MATKFRVELLHGGIRELLTSQAIASECKGVAEEIKSRAGEGFEVLPLKMMDFGGGRVGYAVYTATEEARIAEAEEKTLSKAVR